MTPRFGPCAIARAEYPDPVGGCEHCGADTKDVGERDFCGRWLCDWCDGKLWHEYKMEGVIDEDYNASAMP